MKRYVVTLEKEERDELAGITRKGSHQSQKVINALILLNCDEGEFNEHRARGEAIAEILHISARKVDRVKKRFVEAGMEAALGGRQGRRPSYVRKADGEFEARLVALSCAEPPEGHSQWSLRLLADRVVELGHIDSVSHETVRRVLKKRNQAVATRRLGDSPTGQRGLRRGDGEGTRRLPASLRCNLSGGVHGRDARQLVSETREPVPPAPGRPAREDYEYRRCGSCNVFMATEPLAGRRMTKVTARRNQNRLGALPQRHRRALPRAKRITLLMDNLNTHRPGALYEAFPPAEAKALWDRFEFVYTPKHGSWLNVAEVELSVMTRQCLNRRIASLEVLRDEVAAWQASRDRIQSKVNWQFTTDDARVKLKRLYQTFDE